MSITDGLSRRGALAVIGGSMVAAGGLRAASGEDAIRHAIPSTGETIPVIGLGTSRTFDVGDSEAELDRLVEVMQIFFDRNGTVIDSSPMYGTSEIVIGKLLERIGKPDDVFAATKVWIDGQAAGVAQMDESMERMGVSVMDLMQVHNLRDWRSHLETLKAWKDEGKIRYIGITTSHGRDHDDFEQVMQSEPLDFVQFSYNVLDRQVEERLLPLAADRGMATMINRPFQRGELFQKAGGKALPDWAAEIDCTTWAQVFLKFIVSHPAVTCVIPATAKAHHMEDNMSAGFGRLPDAALRAEIIATVEAL